MSLSLGGISLFLAAPAHAQVGTHCLGAPVPVAGNHEAGCTATWHLSAPCNGGDNLASVVGQEAPPNSHQRPGDVHLFSPEAGDSMIVAWSVSPIFDPQGNVQRINKICLGNGAGTPDMMGCVSWPGVLDHPFPWPVVMTFTHGGWLDVHTQCPIDPKYPRLDFELIVQYVTNG